MEFSPAVPTLSLSMVSVPQDHSADPGSSTGTESAIRSRPRMRPERLPSNLEFNTLRQFREEPVDAIKRSRSLRSCVSVTGTGVSMGQNSPARRVMSWNSAVHAGITRTIALPLRGS